MSKPVAGEQRQPAGTIEELKAAVYSYERKHPEVIRWGGESAKEALQAWRRRLEELGRFEQGLKGIEQQYELLLATDDSQNANGTKTQQWFGFGKPKQAQRDDSQGGIKAQVQGAIERLTDHFSPEVLWFKQNSISDVACWLKVTMPAPMVAAIQNGEKLVMSNVDRS